jgi:hypothetical protein
LFINNEQAKKMNAIDIPCGKTTGNLMQGKMFITFARLTPWQDHGEYAHYPFN